MSVVAPSISCISSILRRHASRNRISEQRVRFRLPENVKKVFLDFTIQRNIKPYEELIYAVRDGEYLEDGQLLHLIKDVRECISLLDRNLHHFVEAVVAVNWFCRSNEVIAEFQGFILDLLSAHNYYTKYAVEKLITVFRSGGSETEWTSGIPSQKDQQMFAHVHDLLRILLQVVPMSYGILVKTVANCFPYQSRPAHEQECFIYNVLKITEYQPQLQREFLFLIFKRLVVLDVNSPRADVLEEEEYDDADMGVEDAEMFVMETNENEDPTIAHLKMKHPLANSLDAAMRQIFLYINSECFDSNKQLVWERTKKLYHDIISVFDHVVLTTHATYHIQFLIFYLCSLKLVLTEGFLHFLWQKVISPNVAPVIRQSAVMYISSLLCRASYVNIGTLKIMIGQLSSWIHQYIACQDGLECANSDVRVHGVFYSVCQSLFYVTAFRHRDLVGTKKNLTFLQSLNLMKIVTCKLNPLKVCLPVVVQNFAAVTRKYQLAYCYSVMEHNSRNTLPVIHQDHKGGYYTRDSCWLETFFPFDPFILKRCSQYIEPIYSVYKSTEQENPMLHCKNSEEPEDEDDFLTDNPTWNISTLSEIFSYSTSPGFKKL